MRHHRKRRRLQRNFSHRKQLLENLVGSLFQHQQIRTTWVKAKEAQRLADRLITLGKDNTLAARRRAFDVLGSREMIVKLFNHIAPRFSERNGGYTRVLHLGNRKGDAAPMALLELTEKEIIQKKEPEKRAVRAKDAEPNVPKSDDATSASPVKPSVPKGPESRREVKPKRGLFGGFKKFFRKRSQGE
jgi:large subunit ribosomal protein L17